MRLGIYGGTFDPPHKGHSTAATAAIQELKLDKLLIIPAAQPPHKKLPADEPGADMRFKLTRLAMNDVDKAIVSNIEIARGGRSYTVDTVQKIAEKYPDADLYLLMGTDMLFSFESWKDFRKIMEKTTLAVFSRRDGEYEKLVWFAGEIARKYGAEVKVIPNDAIEVSSTDLRGLLKLRRGREYLEDSVYGEIIKYRLYGAKPEFQWLREKAYAMLKPSRIPHVQGCEMEARFLARRWGEDPDRAGEAAILHDVTKKENLDVQLRLCKKYGIIPDNMEQGDTKLLHSITGAAVARYEFGCDDDICSAIRWHTTGRTGMTLLEKIIYLADYIEPTRDFPGVEELRKISYTDIDDALEMGFSMSLDEMKREGITPHVNTFEALEWIRDIKKDKD